MKIFLIHYYVLVIYYVLTHMQIVEKINYVKGKYQNNDGSFQITEVWRADKNWHFKVAKWHVSDKMSYAKKYFCSKDSSSFKTRRHLAGKCIWVYSEFENGRSLFSVFVWVFFYWKEISTQNNLCHYREWSETGDWHQRAYTLFQFEKKKKRKNEGLYQVSLVRATRNQFCSSCLLDRTHAF